MTLSLSPSLWEQVCVLHHVMVGSWLGHKHGHYLPSAVLYMPVLKMPLTCISFQMSGVCHCSSLVDETAAHLAVAFGI